MNEKIYRYLDGNGNEYVIKGEPHISLEYNPIKPLHSSSGIYDGGEHKKKQITSQQYKNIIKILEKAVAKKEIHMINRVKLSGMIIIQENSKQSEYILEPHSREIYFIEENLKKVMKD